MRVQLLADFYGDNYTKTLIYAIVGLFGANNYTTPVFEASSLLVIQ